MTVKKGWGYWKYEGEEAEQNGDFNKAVELYSLAIIECPSNEDAFISRGYVKCDLLEFDGAIDDFTEAIEINPRNKYGYINRAYVNLNLGNFEDVPSTHHMLVQYRALHNWVGFPTTPSAF